MGFCPSCFTFGSFSSTLMSLLEFDLDIAEDDDDDEEGLADLKLLLCPPKDD